MWNKRKIKKVMGWILAAALIMLNYSPPVQRFFALPDVMSLQIGQSQQLDLGLPLPLDCTDLSVVGITSPSIRGTSVELTPQSIGETDLRLKLFGVLPVKRINLQIIEKRYLIPGGQTIGIALYTEAPLVVGRSDVIDEDNVVRNPARECDLRPGDSILRINGIAVEDADQLSDLVNELAPKGPLKITVLRDEEELMLMLYPVKDHADGKYRIGVWVRDSTAGIGTVTYYDPVDSTYGALGHGITDADTGVLLKAEHGKITDASITDVRKGTSGAPGELKGAFSMINSVGTIRLNTASGIYGTITANHKAFDQDPIPIAAASAIHLGDAVILSTVAGNTVQAYACKIIKLNASASPNTKSMVIEIVDKTLLDRTGGIVQGMSGSPILQDGKLIGAVTHVLVNDPTKGYGISIEKMLEAADSAA